MQVHDAQLGPFLRDGIRPDDTPSIAFSQTGDVGLAICDPDIQIERKLRLHPRLHKRWPWAKRPQSQYRRHQYEQSGSDPPGADGVETLRRSHDGRQAEGINDSEIWRRSRRQTTLSRSKRHKLERSCVTTPAGSSQQH